MSFFSVCHVLPLSGSCLAVDALFALENFSQDHVRHHFAVLAVLAAPKAAFLRFVLWRLVLCVDCHGFFSFEKWCPRTVGL
jgi:hypothetical protein